MVRRRRSSRHTEIEPARAVSEPDLQCLNYLVFEGRKPVAAFALRDDAEQWIEEFGHRAMKLRKASKPGKVR
jgi:hypothetical protein